MVPHKLEKKQAKLVKFLESIDLYSVPFVTIDVSQVGSYLILAFDSVSGVEYGIEARSAITGTPTLIGSVFGNGDRLQVAVPIDSTARFFRLVTP